MPRSKVDPGRPSECSPLRILRVGFWHNDAIAICILDSFHRPLNLTGLYQASGSADFPVAYVVLCVRFNEVV
jgi:hypothetical protein